MKERLWEKVAEDLAPADKKVTTAELQEWNTEIASDSGFVDLLPEVEPDLFFYVAVGNNANGEVVGAYLLRKTPIGDELSKKQREIDELFLRNRTLKVFELIPEGNMV